MKLKKAILAVMDRDRLRQAMDDLELGGADRRSREEMAAALGRARRAVPETLLEYLSEEQVKEVCELVGVETTGRRNVLIQRLVRRERRLRKLAAAALSGELGDATGMTSDGEADEAAADDGDDFADDEADLPQFAGEGRPPAPVRLPDAPPGMMRVTKTELVWPGKYNDDGTLNEVPRVSLPFQVIERVNESRATREARKQRGASLFDVWERGEGDTFETGWRNKLIWGDNLLVMNSLLEQFAGKIDLIYIDPPFATGADFSFMAQIGDTDEDIKKEQSVLEEKAYRDTWGRGIESYLTMLRDRIVLMRELLSNTGTMYLHLDETVAHYVKVVMDDIFGRGAFRNDIIVRSTFSHADANQFGSVHQNVLFYSKSQSYKYRPVYVEYSDDYVEKYYRYRDENGRRWLSCSLTGAGASGGQFAWRGVSPPSGRHWAYTAETLDSLDKNGRVYWTRNGIPRLKQYLDEMPGMPASDVWQQFPPGPKMA